MARASNFFTTSLSEEEEEDAAPFLIHAIFVSREREREQEDQEVLMNPPREREREREWRSVAAAARETSFGSRASEAVVGGPPLLPPFLSGIH